MNCYSSIKRLCEQKGISPTTLCKQLDLSTSMTTRWKNGTIPRGVTLRKLADYFGVSEDEVLGISAIPQDLPEVVAFRQNFIRLCNQRGEAPSAVCLKVGLSNATFSQWDDNSVPRRATLTKLADYFGVSVDALLDPPGNLCRTVSDEEYEIILALRRQPDMLTPVRRLLALPDEVPTP